MHVFSSRLLFSELINVSTVCNRITLISTLQKFTDFGETWKNFEHYFLHFNLHYLDRLNYFESFCHPVHKSKHDTAIYIENILTLIDIRSFYASHVDK